jgi:dTDP-4-dehydrorhamnose reductase
MQKILITGANGLLGQKLVKLYIDNKDVQVIATGKGEDRNPVGKHEYLQLDITSKDEVSKIIGQVKPDVVINTAAMTNVDKCELDPDSCWKLNVLAVDYLLRACAEHTVFLIHLSSDFIFDGENGPYKEDDVPNPQSKYAESKLMSERLVEQSNLEYAIVRTVLVYGIVPRLSRTNIILWVKKNLEEGKHIRVVNDQWRTPTLAEDLAKGCALIAEKRAKGIFHISGKDMLTPYEMAIATADYFELDKSFIAEVDGSTFTQPAKRPAKTGFVLDKARSILGYEPVSFDEGLAVLEKQLAYV